MVKRPKNGDEGAGLGPEDKHLWEHVTKEVVPLSPGKKKAAVQSGGPVKTPPPKGKTRTPLPKRPSTPKDTPSSFQIDARTDSKLRRGKMPIEARIDLHGYTQDQAHTSLGRFLTKCHAQDMRCVLVITGKGVKTLDEDSERPVRGVIKKMLPLWLSMSPLKSIVLKYYPAQIQDGGEGAFYIYLKRRR